MEELLNFLKKNIKAVSASPQLLQRTCYDTFDWRIYGSKAVLEAEINGKQHELCLGELLTGTRTYYLGGFVSPAVCFHRAVPRSEYHRRFAFNHQGRGRSRDWYHVRVRQRNDQWAWSSPIWVEQGPD